MEFFLQILGYGFILVAVAVIGLLFCKLLYSGITALNNDDD